MLSEILSKQDLDTILRAPTIEEAWNALTKTAYGDWIPQYTGQGAFEIEWTLHHITAHRFARAGRVLTGKPRRAADLLLSRWDLDTLEHLLRLWHGKVRAPDGASVYRTFVHVLPAEKILQAETLHEIITLLRNTPYAEPIAASVARYEEKGAILYVETALERDHYQRLLTALKVLHGRDRRDGTVLVNAEIDMVNLAVFARLFQYYADNAADFSDILIPGPSTLSKQLVRPDMTSETFDELCGGFFAHKRNSESLNLAPLERAALLETTVNEMTVDLARRALAGYPFSITGIQALYILKRVELKNLRGIFAAKACGLGETAVSARIHGAR